MWWSYLVVFHCFIHISVSLKFMTHPEAHLNMTEKIKKHGYPVEIHQVTTEDDYILTIHRVPYGRRPSNNTKRSPVLLLHGMGAQPEYFLVLGRRSIVYYLADQGFDVWIYSARGTTYSQKHKYLDIDKDPRYFMFSYHEIGVYDVPANIDYIVNKTKQKVFVIGHSQGNTCYFVMAAERPEYNNKVKVAVAYAPSLLLQYMDYPFAILFCYVVELFEIFYDFLGFGVLVPVNEPILRFVSLLCSETTYFMQICINMLSIIGSHESKLITKVTTSHIFSVPLAKIAARQLLHSMQCIKSGSFRQYDYGEDGNLMKYNSKSPPVYNITNIVAPVALFYGENDAVTSVEGVEETLKILPNVILGYKVPYKYFNHIDFLFGNNASALVYKRTAQLFKDFDNENN